MSATTSDITIDFEWVDAPKGVQGAELKATWARLSIIVDGYPVTRVYDECSKTTRDFVCLPLHPLAEWLAEQWWHLWSEQRPLESATAENRADYNGRHSFVNCREGYALPPIQIELVNSFVLVSWLPERLPNARLEFLGQGTAWFEMETIRDKFSLLVDAVVDRLHANKISDTYLQQELFNI